MIKKSRKENKYLYNTFLTKNNRNTVNYNPHFKTGHVVLAGIVNHLLLQPILYFLQPQQSPLFLEE